MHEIIVNLHMHTRYSDGSGTHKDIAQAAMGAGLDAVIVTDHNVLVQGVEGYYRSGPRRVLLMVGQEVHDQSRNLQKNHLLVFNANRDVSAFAQDPQRLIDTVREAEGLSFIAHPRDCVAKLPPGGINCRTTILLCRIIRGGVSGDGNLDYNV